MDDTEWFYGRRDDRHERCYWRRVGFVIFLALAMGLPWLFLRAGSFNLAAPGQAAVYGIANWTRAFADT